jgi:2-methylcitrate dehydratase
MTQTERIAEFAHSVSFNAIPSATIDRLKLHLLDAIASFVWAQFQELPANVKKALTALSPDGIMPADHLAQLYTTYIRYPDFMDNFLAKESTCHPSDNIGILLAAGHLEEIQGKDFLTAMAISYDVECRLTELFPVMIEGYDHTVLLSFSATAGAGRLLGLSREELTNALGIAGCSFNPVVTSRASYTSQWKGLVSSMVNAGCMNILSIAKQGITGPEKLFEIPEKGLNAIYKQHLDVDWSKEDFSIISRCSLKTFNAEVHAQSVLELISELAAAHRFAAGEIEQVDITTFLTAYHIIGNGEYGDRTVVYSKEQADHSLPYLAAVTILDKQVYPQQLIADRITSPDVQELLKKVKVHTGFPLHKPVKVAGMLDPYTSAYPDKVKCKVEIVLKDGKKISGEKETYKGFYSTPLTYEEVQQKFIKLNESYVDRESANRIFTLVSNLENASVKELLDAINFR